MCEKIDTRKQDNLSSDELQMATLQRMMSLMQMMQEWENKQKQPKSKEDARELMLMMVSKD